MNMLNEDPGAKPEDGAQLTPVAVSVPAYEEPMSGGSYMRDPETGALVRIQPDEPEQPQE